MWHTWIKTRLQWFEASRLQRPAIDLKAFKEPSREIIPEVFSLADMSASSLFVISHNLSPEHA